MHPKRVGKGFISRLTPKANTQRQTEIRNNIRKEGRGLSGSGDGWTLLHYFSDQGHILAVQLLLEKGADIEGDSKGAGTALNCAAMRGHADVVRILLDQGAEMNTRDLFGRTPLIQASRWGHENVVEALLEHGADFGAGDDEGKTAWDRTMECEWGSGVRSLLEGAMSRR